MILTSRNLYVFVTLLSIVGWIWLVVNLFLEQHSVGVSVCLSKQITDVPCPSCGSTRSVLSVFRGDFLEAIFRWNPLGIVVSLALMILPIWLVYDFLTKKQTLYQKYITAENLLKNPYLYIPLFIFLALNWIWNIYKGL